MFKLYKKNNGNKKEEKVRLIWIAETCIFTRFEYKNGIIGVLVY